MGAQFDIVVTGLAALQKAVATLDATAASQLAVERQSLATSKALNTLTSDGFARLEKELVKMNVELKKVTTSTIAQTSSAQAAERETVKQIATIKSLVSALQQEANTQSAVTDAIISGKVAATNQLNTLVALTTATDRATVRMREKVVVTQSLNAATSQLSTSYGRISSLIGERTALESGAAQVLTKRVAAEQALTVVAQERVGVEGIVIRNIQTRIVAESALTNAQKMRAMVTLGLIDAETATVAASNTAAAANNKLAGTYDLLEKEMAEAAAINKVYNTQLATGYLQQQKLGTQQDKLVKGSRDLKNSQTELGSAFRGVGAATGTLFLTYGKMVPMIAAFVATAATMKSLKLATEFDYITRYATEVAKSSGDASVSLEQLRTTILGFSGLSRGPIEIADGYRELVKAGYSAVESLQQIEYATKFAVVSEMELGAATQSLVGLTRAFAEEGQDMAKVADIIAKAALLSSTDVKEMTDAMAHMTELASVADISLTEAATAMGLMANAGIRGSKAATSVRTAILRILSPTESLQNAMDAAGVSIAAISDDGKIKGMKELFESIQKIINVLPKKEQIGFLADVFDIRTLKGAATLLTSIQTGSWDEFNAQLREAKGYVGDLHEELKFSSKFWAEELSASFEKAALSAVEAEVVTEHLKALNDIVSNPAFTGGLTLLAGGVLQIGGAFLSLVGGPLGALQQIIEKLREFRAELSVFYDLPDIKLPDFMQKKDGGLLDSMLSFNPIKKLTYVGKKIGGFIDSVSELTVGNRQQQFMNEQPRRGSIPLTSATGFGIPDFAKHVEPATEELKKSTNEANEAISYAIVSLNPTVNRLTDEADKYHSSVAEKVAKSGTDTERMAFEVSEAQDRASRLIDNIKKSEDFGLPELAPRKEAKIKQIESDLALEVQAIKKSYDTKEQATVGGENRLVDARQNALKRLAAMQIEAMPEGMNKDLAQIAKKHQEAVDELNQAKAEGAITSTEFTNALNAENAAFARGNKKIETEWMTEYADSVADARNELAALATKDKTLGGMAKEMDKISVSFDKFRNNKLSEILEIGNDTSAEAQATAAALREIVEESYDAEDGLKKAFNKQVFQDFNDELADINKQFRETDAHTARVEELSSGYDDLAVSVREMYKEDVEGNKISAEGLRLLGLINVEKKKTIENDIEALRTSNDLWSGFKAGAMEAQNEMKKLGELGYEIFQDLHEGLKNVFLDIFKGNDIKESFNDMLKSMKNTVFDFAADRLATGTIDLGVQFLESIGLGSIGGIFGERGSTPTKPVYVSDVNGPLGGLLGGEGGGLFGGAGGFLGSLKGWVGNIFGKEVADGLGTLASGLGIAGGAYGIYSGIKNLKEGNTGTGALQVGLGATSVYRGAVGLGILEKGAATEAARWAAGKLGFETAATKATEVIAAEATERTAMYAAQNALLENSATSASSASLNAAEAAYLAKNATTAAQASYGVLAADAAGAGYAAQAGYTGYTMGSGLGYGASGSYGVLAADAAPAATTGASIGASMATVAPYAIAAVAAFLVAKGAIDKGNRPSASTEIDKAGITPRDLGPFIDQISAIQGSVLQAIPDLNRYSQAIYDQDSHLLVATGGLGTLALKYDETAEAGHQWETRLRTGSDALREAAIGQAEAAGIQGEGMGATAEIAYI